MSQGSEYITINYDEFAQLFEAGRIRAYMIGDIDQNPVSNLLARKASLMNPDNSATQRDWVKAAEASENAMIARLADVDYVYMHLSLNPRVVIVTSECGQQETCHHVALNEDLLASKIQTIFQPLMQGTEDQLVM